MHQVLIPTGVINFTSLLEGGENIAILLSELK